jgi:hypothetical protein
VGAVEAFQIEVGLGLDQDLHHLVMAGAAGTYQGGVAARSLVQESSAVQINRVDQGPFFQRLDDALHVSLRRGADEGVVLLDLLDVSLVLVHLGEKLDGILAAIRILCLLAEGG